MGGGTSASNANTTTTTQSFASSFNKSLSVTQNLDNLGNVYFQSPSAGGGAAAGAVGSGALPYLALAALAAGVFIVSRK
jgi:hypothetical protein